MTQSKLNSRQKGLIGEEIASNFLIKRGFSIVEKNYLKKWGEIDIVAKKGDIIHFFEVKSATGNTKDKTFRPEENVHVLKRNHLRRVIQTYLTEKRHGLDAEFYFHVIVVKMNIVTRRAKVSMIENVIL